MPSIIGPSPKRPRGQQGGLYASHAPQGSAEGLANTAGHAERTLRHRRGEQSPFRGGGTYPFDVPLEDEESESADEPGGV